MSLKDTASRGIRYDPVTDEADSHVDSPRRMTEYEEDAKWSWEAGREMDRQGTANEAIPLVDDRQSGATSPTATESLHKASR